MKNINTVRAEGAAARDKINENRDRKINQIEKNTTAAMAADTKVHNDRMAKIKRLGELAKEIATNPAALAEMEAIRASL